MELQAQKPLPTGQGLFDFQVSSLLDDLKRKKNRLSRSDKGFFIWAAEYSGTRASATARRVNPGGITNTHWISRGYVFYVRFMNLRRPHLIGLLSFYRRAFYKVSQIGDLYLGHCMCS